MINIVLLDTQELIAEGLRAVLQQQTDIRLISYEKNLDNMHRLNFSDAASIIVTEVLFGTDKIDHRLATLINMYPKVLLYTHHKQYDQLHELVQMGAAGIVWKDQSVDILFKAIRVIANGELWLGQQMGHRQNNYPKHLDNEHQTFQGFAQFRLTPREIQIASFAACGLNAKNIASKLFVSEKTIRNQLVSIYSKIGVSSHVELVLKSYKLGLVNHEILH